MPYKIKVPYAEKDDAKALGAKWDPQNKTWFIPDNVKYDLFTKWFEKSEVDFIAKIPVYVVLNYTYCWKCNKKTPVITFCSEKNISIEKNQDGILEFFDSDDFSILSYISFIPNELVAIVKQHFPFYSLSYSKTIENNYWINHCKFCKAIQGDFYLHDEPGAAFFPMDKETAEEITLIKLPLSYDVGLIGGCGQSTTDEYILKYSPKILLQQYK